MFTGIISDIGKIQSLVVKNEILTAKIACHSDPDSIDLGASIACDGVCLTVTHVDASEAGAEFDVDISKETVDVTNLGQWKIGNAVNLERAMRIGEEIGGHIVSGHVDGLAKLTEIENIGDNRIFTFEAPDMLAKFIAAKGSVALNGTSLTVNLVDGHRFSVNIIPHTLEMTTWGEAKTGEWVNLEVDMMARYVARLREFD